MEKEQESFLASYLAAYRIAGYLFVNELIKPKNIEQEAAATCEFAGQIREVSKSQEIKDGLLAYHKKYGLDGIIAALEFDLNVRGSEWDKGEMAKDTLDKLRSFSEI